jgi:H+/Cl- antiporter ClcA
MRPRLVVGFMLLPLSVAAWALSIGLNLNGRQYDAWVASSALLGWALLLLGLAAFVNTRWEPQPSKVGVGHAAAALAGFAGFGACLGVTFERFHDGYAGSLVRPELLAWLGAAAFLAAVLTLLVGMTVGRARHTGGGNR